MKYLLILLSAITLASCAYPVPVKLPLPKPLTYPTIKAEDLKCLSDKSYESLVVRDEMKTRRIKTLTNIIKATQ